MRIFPRFSDPLIQAAYKELERFEAWADAERGFDIILSALVHGDAEVVRAQLLGIGSASIRYELLTALFGAHGDKRDLAQLRLIVPDESSPDAGEMARQTSLLALRIATRWRSKPEKRVMSSDYRARMLDRSDARLEIYRTEPVPPAFLINEYCVRISHGDASVIGAVRELAGDDVEYRDLITTAMVKGHAYGGSPLRARGALEYVMLPMHRIEVLALIACVESELGVDPLHAVQH